MSALVLHYVEQGIEARGSRASHGGVRTAAWRPRWRSVEQVAGAGVGEVDAGLGQILADLDLMPKTKFEARELLYIFYLKCIVIRVVD